MKRANKQLVIRLLIVGAVLAVGIAAIASSLVSSRDTAQANAKNKKTQSTQVAQQNPVDGARPKPIPGTEPDPPLHSAVEQPASSSVSSPRAVRPVSLEQQLAGSVSQQPEADRPPAGFGGPSDQSPSVPSSESDVSPPAPAFGGSFPARATATLSDDPNPPPLARRAPDASTPAGGTAGIRSVYSPPFGGAVPKPSASVPGSSPVASSGIGAGSVADPELGSGFPIAVPPTSTNRDGAGSLSAQQPADRTLRPADSTGAGLPATPNLRGTRTGLAAVAAGVGGAAVGALGASAAGSRPPQPLANPVAVEPQPADSLQRADGANLSPTQIGTESQTPLDSLSSPGDSGSSVYSPDRSDTTAIGQATSPTTPATTQTPPMPDSPPDDRFEIGATPASPTGQVPGTSAASSTGPATLGATPDSIQPLVTQATGLPGDQRFEGQQLPSIAIEKTAPEEIQVNRKAVFQILVRNSGNVPAHNVIVVDRVPRGTRFVATTPQATKTEDGVLIWQLGTLKPGSEQTLAMEVLPQMEGEIGSVAQVSFQAQATVRSICTKPKLSVKLVAPEKVLIGQNASLDILVTNTGTGAATNVMLEEDVPEGFTHAAGGQLEHSIGTLRPGQSVRLSLVLDAAKVGRYENRLSVRGDGELSDQNIHSIEVIAPDLQMTISGPARRYLDRQATYVVQISNPGTAPANNIETVVFLPRGMKYVTSDNQGQYDPQTHGVYWSLKELPVGKQGEVRLTVLPIEPGEQKFRIEGKADLGLAQNFERQIAVEGIAELRFALTDVADPIEVGTDTTYEVRIQNHGSKADTNIRVTAVLPEGLKPTTGDGPSRATVQGQQVVFAPVARLAPDEEIVLKIHAQGNAAGDHVVRVQLQSDELKVPVAKEEITRVYSDR